MEDGVDMAQAIAELRKLSAPELVERYREVFGKEPRVRNREYVLKRVIWKVQENRLGGLSEVAKRRLEELIGEIRLPPAEDKRTIAGKLKHHGRPGAPAPGTTLTRAWRGQTIQVRVLETGFEWNNTVFKSLSATARAITGSHWNPTIFFKLAPRKKVR